MYVCRYVYTHTCMHTNPHKYIKIHLHTHIYTHTFTYTYTHGRRKTRAMISSTKVPAAVGIVRALLQGNSQWLVPHDNIVHAFRKEQRSTKVYEQQIADSLHRGDCAHQRRHQYRRAGGITAHQTGHGGKGMCMDSHRTCDSSSKARRLLRMPNSFKWCMMSCAMTSLFNTCLTKVLPAS